MKKKPESVTVRACRVQLRQHLKAISVERDALRDLIEDYQVLADSCDEAADAVRSAIEMLSRYA